MLFLGGQSKEEAMRTQLRLRATRRRLEINYETAKQALVNLHNQYEKSKEVRNIFTRYALLKSMIKVIVYLNILIILSVNTATHRTLLIFPFEVANVLKLSVVLG